MGRNTPTLGRPAPSLPSDAPAIGLTLESGPTRTLPRTAQPVILIGGRRDCDLSINHSEVSQVHCAIVNTGKSLVITDLCSRAGTLVNDEKISVTPLNPGDTLKVGKLDVRLEFDGNLARRKTSSDESTRLSAPFSLSGGDLHYELFTFPAVIGRRKACAVVLDTPDVSLAHTLLIMIAGCPAVFDLGSRSGTYLNGERVALAWLQNGDELSIGGIDLSVNWAGQVAASGARTAQGTAAPRRPAASAAGSEPAAPRRADEPDVETLLNDMQEHVNKLRERVRRRDVAGALRDRELQTALAELTSQRSQLEALQRELDERERELERRAAELAQRESAGAEAARKIEMFKSALNEASTKLAGTMAADAADQLRRLETGPQETPPLKGKEKAHHNGNGHSTPGHGGNGTNGNGVNGNGNGAPKPPLVTRPLFRALQAMGIDRHDRGE